MLYMRQFGPSSFKETKHNILIDFDRPLVREDKDSCTLTACDYCLIVSCDEMCVRSVRHCQREIMWLVIKKKSGVKSRRVKGWKAEVKVGRW